MKINYNDNQYFHFKDKTSLNIDNNLIDEIDQKYKQILNNSFNTKEIITQFHVIKKNIKQVFYKLILQTAKDEKLKFFLEELQEFSLDHLRETKDYYKSLKNDNFKSNELTQDRFFFGILSEEALNQINNISKDIISNLRERKNWKNLNRDKLSINRGRVCKKIREILNQEFDNQNILKKVSNYMKKEYHVTGVAIELSLPNTKWWNNIQSDGDGPKTLYAHVDESDLYPKSICYLSNVDDNNGPTSLYPNIYKKMNLNFLQTIVGKVINNIGKSKNSKLNKFYNRKYHQSMSCENFRKHFVKLPENMQFNSHFGWDVVPGSELENNFVENEVVLKGKSGTFVIFDGGNILHRGGLINSGERIVLQIVFGPKISIFLKVLNKIKQIIKN